MARNPARYAVTYGLSGCYMPDSHLGAFEFNSRRDLAQFIRDELAAHDMPAALFRDAKIRRLWGLIRHNGSSVAHFSLQHGAYELAFHGLTESEFNEMTAED